MAKQLASYDPSNGELLGEVPIAERVALLGSACTQLDPHLDAAAVADQLEQV